jgi:hypothetical protein
MALNTAIGSLHSIIICTVWPAKCWWTCLQAMHTIAVLTAPFSTSSQHKQHRINKDGHLRVGVGDASCGAAG